MSPTARSLKYLREAGFLAEVVEKWIPGAMIRKDFLGIIDILAFRPGSPVMVGVQATSTSNMAARKTKAQAHPNLGLWCSSGHVFQVWGWQKKTFRDGKRPRWVLGVDQFIPMGQGPENGWWDGRWRGDTNEVREALERYTPLR